MKKIFKLHFESYIFKFIPIIDMIVNSYMLTHFSLSFSIIFMVIDMFSLCHVAVGISIARANPLFSSHVPEDEDIFRSITSRL